MAISCFVTAASSKLTVKRQLILDSLLRTVLGSTCSAGASTAIPLMFNFSNACHLLHTIAVMALAFMLVCLRIKIRSFGQRALVSCFTAEAVMLLPDKSRWCRYVHRALLSCCIAEAVRLLRENSRHFRHGLRAKVSCSTAEIGKLLPDKTSSSQVWS